ncbi:hypothetical protein TRVL_09418 [Trypanosoma vivax]|nr:hypothetical protein TRVL_09418 [Trypanosoma vivax]
MNFPVLRVAVGLEWHTVLPPQSRIDRIPTHSASTRLRCIEQYLGGSTVFHARQKTMSEGNILSSKVARTRPFLPLSTALRMPRIPATVFSFAPTNFAASRSLLNMPLTNTVVFWIFCGVPTSFNFFTMLAV